MKLKVWLGSSFVLILTLAATFALFYYFENEQTASLQILQNRVNEIELDRVVERGGQRLYKQTEKMVVKIDKIINSHQVAAEALADSTLFRMPAKAQDKKRALIKIVKKKSWQGAYVTNGQGKIIARAGGSKTATPIVNKKVFKFCKVQRLSTMNSVTVGKTTTLDIMIPCLSDKSKFIGVLNISILFSPKEIKSISTIRGGTVLLGDQSGILFLSTNASIQATSLEQLIGQQNKSVSSLLTQAGPKYFRARWKSKNYILAAASLAENRLFVFSLIPAAGFEKAIASPVGLNSIISNPIILGGYAIIIIVGMILLFIFSGGDNIKKLNHEIEQHILGEAPAEAIAVSGKGHYGKLVDYINMMIERMQPGSQSAQTDHGSAAVNIIQIEAKYKESLNQAYEEIDSLRAQLEQAQMAQLSTDQNQDDQTNQIREQMQQQISALEQSNQELNQNLIAAEQAASAATAAANTETSAPPAGPTISQEELDMIEIIKQSGKLRTEAITNMSEDLKATLLVIKNYISSILSSEEGKITDNQQEFLGVVINKSARLERHINDLLDISHMESEGTDWYTTPTDLVAMLQDVVLNIQPQADTKQIKIVPEIQAHLPLIKINSDRMGQVFIHLVQHAIKITPFGSDVKITATETLSDIVIKVRDGGTPLNPEQSNSVFNSYNGEDTPAGADYAGTGLRFAIIKEIVELHHGSVAMRGLPDLGNEAIVSLSKGKVVSEEDANAMTSFSATTMETPPQVESAPLDYQPEPEPASTSSDSNPLEAYEVKAVEEKGDKNEPSDSSPYDLSAFMGKLGDEPSVKKPQIPSGAEDLDDLLKDIEDIDGQLDS